MSLFVVDTGLASRVVDLGRPRSRSLGVPVGGAADASSLAIGNGLVGNPPEAPALEVALKGPILRADAEIGCVLFGAPFDLSSARQSLRTGRTFTLTPGEELHIGGTPRGMCAYLCVAGGLQTPPVLGSHSGLSNIQEGLSLACAPSRLASRFVSDECPWPDFSTELRCLPGLQADWFEVGTFHGQEFTVTPALNRMGVRIQGEALTVPDRELLSEPVSPGAVQVTRDGQCILLGVDGQTIGGYPKIAQVIRADLDRLGQLRPGVRVRFLVVDQEAARTIYTEKQRLMDQWTRRLQWTLEAPARSAV